MRPQIILKKVAFKNCAPFTDCIIETNNTQTDDAQKKDVVMPMNNLIEYSDAYSKTLGCLCPYYWDTGDDVNITDFPAKDNNSNSLNFQQQITEQTGWEMVVQKMLK